MRFRTLWACVVLLLGLRTLAAENLPPLPAPVDINQDAGCYNLLFVTVRLQDGKELPFVVDTGCPVTVFDKSFAPILGKPLDTTEVSVQPAVQESACYPAPRLYLGNTPLMIGSNVWTLDLHWLSTLLGRPFVGILGMSCLSNYCVQLDFKAGQMRFLDPRHLDPAALGKVLPLNFAQFPGDSTFPATYGPGLLGGTNGTLYIDLGDNSAGEVKEDLLKGHSFVRFLSFLVKALTGVPVRVPVSQCDWIGNTYTNLGVLPAKINRLGLAFMARHNATFDFPDHKLYLKQITAGPREPKLFINVHGSIRTAARLLVIKDDNGQLPGWQRNDRAIVTLASKSRFAPGPWMMKGGPYLKALTQAPLKSVTINFQKPDQSTVFRYTISRASPKCDWTLQKAWETDANGRLLRKIPIP